MTIKILGQELDFDIYDLDTMERYEEAHKSYAAAMQKMTPGNDAKTLKAYCKITADFLDGALGEGTSDRLFGGVVNYRQYLRAGYDLLESVGSQREEFQKEQAERSQRIAKYLPNRRK